MTKEAIEARRAYKREWARKNPDKIKEYQARFYERKAAQAAAEAENGTQRAGEGQKG